MLLRVGGPQTLTSVQVLAGMLQGAPEMGPGRSLCILLAPPWQCLCSLHSLVLELPSTLQRGQLPLSVGVRFLFCEPPRSQAPPQLPWVPRCFSACAHSSLLTSGAQDPLPPAKMLLPLLLALLWAGDLSPEADTAFTKLCEDKGWKCTVQVNKSLTVQEGLCVLLPCRILYSYDDSYLFTHSYGYWFRARADTRHNLPVATNNPERQVQEAQGRFHLLRDVKDDCSLNIRDAQRGDSGSFFFWLEARTYKLRCCSNQVSLHVTGKFQAPNWPRRRWLSLQDRNGMGHCGERSWGGA